MKWQAPFKWLINSVVSDWRIDPLPAVTIYSILDSIRGISDNGSLVSENQIFFVHLPLNPSR